MVNVFSDSTFIVFLDSMRRMNRVARMGCNPEQVLAVAVKIYVDYASRDEVHLLCW